METTCEVIVQKKTLQSKKNAVDVAQNKTEAVPHDTPQFLYSQLRHNAHFLGFPPLP